MSNSHKTVMSKTEDMKQQHDTSNTQDKQLSKYERHETGDTPFMVVETPTETDETKYLVLLGNYKIDELNTLEEALKSATDITWERVIQVIGMMIENKEKMK